MNCLKMTLKHDDKSTVRQIRYLEQLEQFFEFTGDELLKVYESETAILLNLETSATLSAGDHSFRGTIQIQACSDNVCLAPADVELTFPSLSERHRWPRVTTRCFRSLNRAIRL